MIHVPTLALATACGSCHVISVQVEGTGGVAGEGEQPTPGEETPMDS